MFVVLGELLLEDVEFPSRDGVVPPQNNAELPGRIVEGHGCVALPPFLV